MLRYLRSARGRIPPFALLATTIFAAGCSSSGLGPGDQAAGMACIDDSKACIEQRQAALKSLLADQNRAWVRQPASPAAYASGVRLFALRSKRRELTCDELMLGRRETDGAATVLRGPGGSGLSPAQISRGTLLAAEVGRELATEMQRRCKA